MPELPSGTVTFLFTDVEGSTKLLHELGVEGYAEALAEHRRVIREACAAHGGVEVDTQGDAFFFAFRTAPGALAAAGEMTEALASGPIQVRVGLHTGTPLLTEGGYVGGDVHRAARIAAAGHGGQALISSSTAELVELELTDLGEHRLKDIPEAVPIFQLGDGSFPPLKTISNTNLPRPTSSFVGRDDELLEVLARIEAGARLVTLTGPGGTGKTRLAIEAAATLVPEYKAGVFWVGLASLRDPALVTETIAQTLGAKDGLARHVGEREMMLLLDNLEQVVECAPELASLLEACPNLTLLVTSRELLRVRGEVEYAVPPLAEPEAVDLFCARSQLDADETIAELCRRLDDMPLAVELAAARTSALTPQQIQDRLSQRLDLLQGGRDADPRQQTLRATIEWSFDLLSAEEQRLFASLAVFAGGCTLEAAEDVCDADLDTLQSLVEKSLLRFTDERYWLLETIREYGVERLIELGERDSLVERLALWLLRLADGEGAPMYLGRQEEAFARLELEHSNVRSALNWAVSQRDASTLTALVGRFQIVWSVHGHLAESKGWADAALAARPATVDDEWRWALWGITELASARGEYEHARSLTLELLELGTPEGTDSRWWRSALLAALSNIAIELDDFDGARELLEESLELRRDTELPKDRILGGLGHVALRTGDLPAAEEWFTAAIEDKRARHTFNRATWLQALGEVRRRRGDIAGAMPPFTSALGIYHDLGVRPGMAECLEGLAMLAAENRDLQRAARLWRASVTLRAGESREWPERALEFTDDLAPMTAEDAIACVQSEID